MPQQFLESFTLGSNIDYQNAYVAAGGTNGIFDFPPDGTHSWPYWACELQKMLPDIKSTLGVA